MTAPADRAPGLPELLGRALDEEVQLLESLDAVLLRQREAVARDDLDGVNASVADAQRVLLTLGQARRRRETLLSALCGGGDVSLEEVERVLGDTLHPALVTSRDRLLSRVAAVSRTLRVNHRILAGAAAAGQALMRGLGAPVPAGAGVYGAEGPRAAAPVLDPGLVFDRQV